MVPLRKPLIGFFSHSLHFGWKGICVLLSPQNTVCIALLCCFFFFVCVLFSRVFPPPLLAFSPSLLLFPSPLLPLSPHLMRPHNNTAVVQLFCYLSQTAGSLHRVFLLPFTCLLRQGNEYHLEVQSTGPQKNGGLSSLVTPSKASAWIGETSNKSTANITGS